MRHFVALSAAILLASCTPGKQESPWLTYPECTSCHGDFRRGTALADSAPPFDVAGDTSTTAPGVGAHARHLEIGVSCGECHPLPAEPMHSNGVVEVMFGPISSTLFDPIWSPTALTCSTYCHGGTSGGGTLKLPVWTKVDGTQAACGTCHGVPPPQPHIQSSDCGGCHPGYTDRSVNLLTHVDGMLQTTGGCTSCHGDPGAPALYAAAPPRDTRGNTLASAPGVGAHVAHVADGPLRVGIACTECHPSTNPRTHPDHTLHVTFGPLAAAAGSAAEWTPATLTCASTYCHGSAAMGATAPAPVWTSTDGSARACNSCHGVPPPSPHPDDKQCGDCHKGYTSSTVVRATHIDGVIDMDPTQACSTCTCTVCHGDSRRLSLPSSSAPPRDVSGNTLASALGVGAHQVHLDGGPVSFGVSCTECHPVPDASPGTSTKQGVHQNGTVDVVFGPLSNTSTVASLSHPTVTSATCATYCHGATLSGGTNRTPSWTGGSAEGACGTCHGVPPPLPHTQLGNCGGCHPGSTRTSVDKRTHVNGLVETVTLTCSSCHGNASVVLVPGADARTVSAPPPDTLGSTATSLRSVGAHMAHLNRAGSNVAAPTACTECHVVPSSMAHADGTVNVTFGAKARTGNLAPMWNGATCSATYCHGATLTGGNATAPVWTTVDGSQRACNSCHGNPPATGEHLKGEHQRAGCGACHPGYSSTAASLTIHIDGIKQTGAKTTSYNPTTRSCTSTCHGRESW